jgi:hypothetical protein
VFVFEPEEFVARLAALVPPPRFHLVRYAVVLVTGAQPHPAGAAGGEAL